MEIQKRLILNKTPKDMPYGSIPCAKNMMIDDTGSFLTNDIGFDTSFYGREGEKIVGVIPCDSEIVIFTYIEEYDEEIDNEIIHHPAESTIYRKPDNIKITSTNRNVYKINCNWQWHKGTLCGSYTYNYKGELIIALGEYNSPIDDYKHIPLKSWNLDSASLKQTYNIEEDIPKYKSGYIVGTNGNLVCGVYTFFIRFKIDEYNFTKWFQITGDINIIQEALSKKYTHYYLEYYNDLAHDNRESTRETNVLESNFTINNNEISNKNINISLSFLDYTFDNLNFDKFQLGYIIKRNSDVSGRIQGEYTIDSVEENGNKISVVNNNFIEEVSVDELLETPHQFFNVKNIINYNNRLYIANYEEYALEDLTVFSKDNTTITIDTANNANVLRRSSRKSFVSGDFIISFRLWQEGHVGGNPHWGPNITPDLTFTLDENGYMRKQDYQNLLEHLTTFISFHDYSTVDWNDTGNTELYLFIQKDDGQYESNSALCLAKTDINGQAGTDWDFGPRGELYPYVDEQNFKIKITGSSKDDLDIIIEYNGNSWSLLGRNGEHMCLLYYDPTFETYVVGNGYIHGTAFSVPNPPIHFPNDIQLSINRIGDDDDEPDDPESGGTTKAPGVNTRTLHPFQKYNFFIHYIRKDGSYTNGFQISLDFYNYTIVSPNTVIIPKFNAKNPNPDIYVGYFITYEDVESTVDCVYLISRGTQTTNPTIYFTNAKYLYDIDTIRGKKININDISYIINDIEYIENKLTFNHIKGILALEESIEIDNDQIAYWLKNVENIYNNKTKILYRLCQNIYTFDTDVEDQDYLPAFYGKQIIILYTQANAGGQQNFNPKELILDPASQFVTTFNDGSADPRTLYDVKLKTPSMYSQYPMEAMNIKDDFQQASVVLHVDQDSYSSDRFRVNTVVAPDKLHDLLELKAAYTSKPSKSFTNYNEDNIFTFNKTIYRSDVISDESLENGFRHFDINNYKNILENKGKIVNIIGIGLYLIVHTEYSIFVFDRTPKLTAKSQLDIPDVFDIDYQDVMPSNEGFGGLLEKEESILTKHGYIWYDHNNKIIFNYENGKVTILSADINNFVKNLNVSSVRFAEDITNSRLIICFYTNDYDASYRQVITLSYSFNTNSFISIHDYKFTHNYRTAKKSYVFDSTKPGNLYEFSNEYIVNYRELFNPQSFYFPYYASPTGATYSARSYVDIIFNKDYFVSKVVNSIKYILSKIVNNRYPYKITEEQLERHFSGNELKIYTDEVDSGEIDISVDENEINKNEDYKHPYYEKGVWNLSYFRNRINELTHSDDMSLIYGKYIVVRFIFNNNVKVKFEGIDIQTNLY